MGSYVAFPAVLKQGKKHSILFNAGFNVGFFSQNENHFSYNWSLRNTMPSFAPPPII